MSNHILIFHLHPCLFSEPPGQHVNAIGNGYDDVEELPVPEILSSPGMRENFFSPKEGSDVWYSQRGEWTAWSPSVASLPCDGEDEYGPIDSPFFVIWILR